MKNAKRYLRPPCGAEARRLVGWLTLAAGLPRLPLISQATTFAPLRFLPSDVYGLLLVALGAALVYTSFDWRWRTMAGRIAAAAGFVIWTMLAAATISTASFLINASLAAVLMVEVARTRGCGDGS